MYTVAMNYSKALIEFLDLEGVDFKCEGTDKVIVSYPHPLDLWELGIKWGERNKIM